MYATTFNYISLGVTILLFIAGAWLTIRFSGITNRLNSILQDLVSIKKSIDRLENKHFSLTRELALQQKDPTVDNVLNVMRAFIGTAADLPNAQEPLKGVAATATEYFQKKGIAVTSGTEVASNKTAESV
jgi:hypothetical protein